MANALPNTTPKRQVLNRKLSQTQNGKNLGMLGRPGYTKPSNPASGAFNNLQNFLQQNYMMANQVFQQDQYGNNVYGQVPSAGSVASDPSLSAQGQNNPYSYLGNPSYSSIDLTQGQNALPGQPGGYTPAQIQSSVSGQYPGLASTLNQLSPAQTQSTNQ